MNKEFLSILLGGKHMANVVILNKKHQEVVDILNKHAVLDTILKEFPKEYDDGFCTPWKYTWDRVLGMSHNKNVYYEMACIIKCLRSLYKRTNDEKVQTALQIAVGLGGELVNYKNSQPVCIKFRPAHYDECVTKLDKIKEDFFTEEAFGPYKKGCANLADPNIYDTAKIEFGQYKKNNWYRTNLANATHIGIYLDGSYLDKSCLKEEGVCKIFYRDNSSHRRRHQYAFIIREKKIDCVLTSLAYLLEVLAGSNKY